MGDKFSYDLIKRNIKKFGGKLERKGAEAKLIMKGEEISIPVRNGFIDLESIGKAAKFTSEQTGRDYNSSLRELIKKPNFYSIRTPNFMNATLAILIGCVIFLGLSKMTSTAAVIGIPESTANTWLIISVLGILGIMICKLRCK